MKRAWIIRLLAACAVIGFTISAASADESGSVLAARLSGFNNVPPILTNGSGSFSAVVRGDTLTYRLSFSNLTTPVTQAHIHFAQRGVNGGIFIFLCGSAATPGPAGTPACPANGGTVTGTVGAAQVLGPTPDQGLAAGDFAGALRIIRSGDSYVNVHTTRFPAGEIRGQVRVGGDD